METKAIRSELIDNTFKNYCRGKLVSECIRKKIPVLAYLDPFDEVIAGKEIPEGLARELYKKIMEFKKEYK